MRQDLFRMHADLELKHWWFAGRRDIVKTIVTAALEACDRPLIVDVGCGTGANIASFPTAYERVGIDPSPAAITLARARFQGIQFIEGHAPADLIGIAERADMILLMDVLEHVDDDFLLLSQLLAVVKPGARVLITVPAHESLWTQHDLSFGHYRRYSSARLRMLWDGADVAEELFGFFNARVYPLVRLVRSAARARGSASGNAGTDLDLPPRIINSLLRAVFAGERRRLLKMWRHPESPGYRTGVSVMAVLRRGEGKIELRSRPSFVGADVHRQG